MNSKCVLCLGWRDFVVDTNDALTLLGILSKAEVFRETYENKQTAYYVFPQEVEDFSKATLKLLPDEVYKVARMAGKPPSKNL